MPSLSSSSSATDVAKNPAPVGFPLASEGGSREVTASEPNRGLAKESHHHGLTPTHEAPGPLRPPETEGLFGSQCRREFEGTEAPFGNRNTPVPQSHLK